MDFQFYIARFIRQIYYFLIIFLLFFVTGVSVAILLPPKYVARAKLLVESEQIPGDLAASTVQVPAQEQLQIIQQRILTRGILLDMASRLEVYSNYVSRRPLNPDEIVADMRERIVIRLPERGSSVFGASPGAALVDVSFSASNPELSAIVTNEIVTKILNENVEMRTGTASQTLAFFEDEVNRLDRALTEANEKISAFRLENKDALPDSQSFKQNQLLSAQSRLFELERNIIRLQDRRQRIVMIFNATQQAGENTLNPLERQLQDLKDELSSLSVVLTSNNPRIRVLESQINLLESKVARVNKGGEVPAPDELIHQIQLEDIDKETEEAIFDKGRLVKLISDLEEQIQLAPRNAIELDKLERNYNNIRERYAEAVESRSRAQTGDLIETLSKGGRITVIEQAVVPLEPTSPNRPLIVVAGLIGGIAFGIGVVVLIEFMSGAARRPADVIAHLGIAPFATLPIILTQRDIRRRRMVLTGSVSFILIFVPFALWLVHIYVLPLDLLMQRATERFNFVDAAPFNLSHSILLA